jgi:hypothetical protein
MSEVNFDTFKVRCSQISVAEAESSSNPCITEKQTVRLKELEGKAVLTDKMKDEMAELLVKKQNSTKNILSDGYINYLCAEYSYITTGKIAVDKEFLSLEQMEKGKIVEPESIATLCLADGILYTPNDEKERVSNDYLTGEVDAYFGETIMTASIIPDVKSIWDYPTFLSKINQKLSLPNTKQVRGYMDITGATQGFIADVLINTPPTVVESIKWKLLRKLGSTTEESPEFLRKWSIIERSMNFDDIPIPQRVNKKYVEPFTEFERQKIYDKVKYGREWLWNFHEKRTSLR